MFANCQLISIDLELVTMSHHGLPLHLLAIPIDWGLWRLEADILSHPPWPFSTPALKQHCSLYDFKLLTSLENSDFIENSQGSHIENDVINEDSHGSRK